MMQLLLLSSALFLAVSVTADTCPGGRVRCPDFMTCCQLTGDEFGCCPFPDAKCCVDHVHCCPHNMDCDVAHQSCLRKGSPVQFYWQVPVHPEIVEPVVPEKTPVQQEKENEANDLQQTKDNKCPDETKCISSFTCCKMYSGKYGCCPFDNGTCCQDGFHCCPHGSSCSDSGECHSAEMNYTVSAYPMKDKKLEKLLKTERASLRKPHHQDVSDPGGLCPDGHPCPETYTCCKIQGKRYGCCPYTDARCCDDGIHCCPKGTNCNVTLGTCDIQKNFGWSFPSQPLEELQWSDASKGVAVTNHIEEIINDVVCPDETYHCPTGSTCCQLTSGAYGCCPMERATCCKDKEHCCPYSFECTVGGCVKGTSRLPPFLWTRATQRSPLERQVIKDKVAEKTDRDEDVSDVVCPDQYPCPDGNTCCELASGEYGCCPMEKATCCADKIHCCPHGYRCMSEGCRKDSASWSLPLTLNATMITRVDQEHKEAVSKDPGVLCPDQSECPEGSTCCQLASGDYGCCAYAAATCCGDMVHCCPHGYWCSDEGCDRMPGVPKHLTPFLRTLFTAKKSIDEHRSVASMLLP